MKTEEEKLISLFERLISLTDEQRMAMEPNLDQKKLDRVTEEKGRLIEEIGGLEEDFASRNPPPALDCIRKLIKNQLEKEEENLRLIKGKIDQTKSKMIEIARGRKAVSAYGHKNGQKSSRFMDKKG